MPTPPLKCFALLLLLSLLPTHGFAQVQVLASIKPLQLIAAAVTEGVSEPGVIIPPNQSPHDFNLRPSDMRRLVDAGLVLWVGPGLETYLSGVLSQKAMAGKTLEAASVAGVSLLALNEEEHSHEGETYDPHLWLSTANALALARALEARLSIADPRHAMRYQTNLARFENAMHTLQDNLQAQFSTLQETPFAVYHNGTQYLENQLGLQHVFVLVPDHEIQPGIRHLLDLRSRLETLQPVCLLEDVNANAATVDTVFRNYPLRRTMLDTLGENIVPGVDAYANLIAGLATAIAQCLKPDAHP